MLGDPMLPAVAPVMLPAPMPPPPPLLPELRCARWRMPGKVVCGGGLRNAAPRGPSTSQEACCSLSRRSSSCPLRSSSWVSLTSFCKAETVSCASKQASRASAASALRASACLAVSSTATLWEVASVLRASASFALSSAAALWEAASERSVCKVTSSRQALASCRSAWSSAWILASWMALRKVSSSARDSHNAWAATTSASPTSPSWAVASSHESLKSLISFSALPRMLRASTSSSSSSAARAEAPRWAASSISKFDVRVSAIF
mmetsp:Transcript_122824/g.306777  ORF Transcript_122824/g.306777 Transcript_122824/m.306777 type:complete len:264 (+) Transcript_122824:157-948(+)